MAQWGLKEKHFPEPCVEVWEENWEAVQAFNRLSTQWRAGGMGVFGLDYHLFYKEADRLAITGEEFEEFMWRIGVIEAEALKQLRGP